MGCSCRAARVRSALCLIVLRAHAPDDESSTVLQDHAVIVDGGKIKDILPSVEATAKVRRASFEMCVADVDLTPRTSMRLGKRGLGKVLFMWAITTH